MNDPRFSFADGVTSANRSEVKDRLSGTTVRIQVCGTALLTLPGQVLIYHLATISARLFDRVELEGDDHVLVHNRIRLLTGVFLPSLRNLLPTLRPMLTHPANGRVIRVQ